MPALIVPIAVLGLAVGAFLNLVIRRVPAAASAIQPEPRIPAPARTTRARHLLVAAATGALFAAVAARLAALDELAALPAYLFFAAIGVALTVLDIDLRRLPNVIVLPAYPALAGLLAIAAYVQDDPAALSRAGIGAAALFALYLALALAHPGGMGFGDVKLAGVVGGVLGYLSYPALLVGAFAAFVTGGIAGLVVMSARRGTCKSAVPFGPFMIAGALLALFAGAHIADTYVRLISPA
jgi:leader peptidase (prepilin peptidase)/N-methyltransferase